MEQRCRQRVRTAATDFQRRLRPVCLPVAVRLLPCRSSRTLEPYRCLGGPVHIRSVSISSLRLSDCSGSVVTENARSVARWRRRPHRSTDRRAWLNCSIEKLSSYGNIDLLAKRTVPGSDPMPSICTKQSKFDDSFFLLCIYILEYFLPLQQSAYPCSYFLFYL